MLAPYSEIEHMPTEWLDAGRAGIKFWAGFSENNDVGFVQNGSLLISHPEDQHILERFITHLPVELQKQQSTEDLESELPKAFSQGLYLEDEAHLSPSAAMEKLFQETQKYGAEFIQQAIDDEALETMAENFDHIIDCRGIGTSDKELRGVKGEIVIVRNPEFSLARPVRLMHPRYPLYIVPRDDHHFMIGATIIESAKNETVGLRSAMELMSALYSIHPSFGDAEIIDILAGIRPSYPDNLPRIKASGNIISCNGLFRHGFLLSPVMAEAVADRLEDHNNVYMPLFERGSDDEHKHHNQRAA